MLITPDKVGKIKVLALAGRLDTVNCDRLAKVVRDELDRGERWLVFDLTSLDYVTSAPLGVFLTAAKRVQGSGRVCFCGVGGLVKQVFDVTGLSFRVELYPTRADALRSFAAPRPEVPETV